uniref:Reverse transcriptase zinc-binding domain-containing protein n=1 Tax=Globisporangium ultimum (strain ATCC 200006 / CBS 805.95 / DAOM BR144) TaxID=431595 RepID=K3X9U6_GLOUD
MALHNQSVDENEVKRFVRYGKHLRQLLLPVFEDLQFRVAFRLLPVRSRFFFLRDIDPRITYCIQDGCNDVETEQHLFFECTLASRVWEHLLLLMRPLFRNQPTWTVITLARKPSIHGDWKECKDIVCDVWHMLRAVALHFIWSDRNRCLFDGRQPTPATPALSIIFATVSAHIRHYIRRKYESTDVSRLQKVIRTMKLYQPFEDFATAHPSMLELRQR